MWILLRKWIIIVFGVEDFVVFFLKNINVNKIFNLGLGFVFNRKRIDLLVDKICFVFRGVKMLWLIVLFKKSIFVGLIKIFVNGIKWVFKMIFILCVIVVVSVLIIGLIVEKLSKVNVKLINLVEKLFINILKLVLIWCWKYWLNFLIVKLLSGFIIMVFSIIGILVFIIMFIVVIVLIMVLWLFVIIFLLV